MSKRAEFSKAVMVECAKRATREVSPGVNDQYCENPSCGQPTKGRFEIDHINPCGLTGKATIENARLLCIPCHKEKTKADKGDIAKAKRREAAHLGARLRSGRKLQGPQFAQSTKRKEHPVPALPPRSLYEDTRC